MEYKNIREDWYILGRSYFDLALLACRELEQDNAKIQKLYIPIIYNMKHAIELYLKYFIVTFQKTELIKKQKKHNNVITMKQMTKKFVDKQDNIVEIISQVTFQNKGIASKYFTYKTKKHIFEKLTNLILLVKKYQNLECLECLVNNNLKIEDTDNNCF